MRGWVDGWGRGGGQAKGASVTSTCFCRQPLSSTPASQNRFGPGPSDWRELSVAQSGTRPAQFSIFSVVF